MLAPYAEPLTPATMPISLAATGTLVVSPDFHLSNDAAADPLMTMASGFMKAASSATKASTRSP